MANGVSDLNVRCGDAEREHYQLLLANKSLEPFMKLSPSDYLLPIDNEQFIIDSQGLFEHILCFIEELSLTNGKLVDSYSKLIWPAE